MGEGTWEGQREFGEVKRPGERSGWGDAQGLV